MFCFFFSIGLSDGLELLARGQRGLCLLLLKLTLKLILCLKESTSTQALPGMWLFKYFYSSVYWRFDDKNWFSIFLIKMQLICDDYYIHHLSPDFDWWQLCTTNWWIFEKYFPPIIKQYWNSEYFSYFFTGLVLKNSVPISSVVLWNQLKSLLEMLRWTSLLFMISSWLVDPPGFQRSKSWFQT